MSGRDGYSGRAINRVTTGVSSRDRAIATVTIATWVLQLMGGPSVLGV